MLGKRNSIVIMLLLWLVITLNLKAQNTYDIQLAFSHYDTLTRKAHYDVQLRSGTDTAWGLAGQNYRLYYDATEAQFVEGVSKLPAVYQQFNLVQHASNVDASAVNGAIPFAENLGFINFSIDLSDTYNGGVFLPSNREWVTTASLTFETQCTLPENCMQVIWARDGKTHLYATSFVEVSVWESTNTTNSAIAAEYFDIVKIDSQKALKIRVFLQGAYDEITGLMRDDLRKMGYLPLEEPYSTIKRKNGESIFKVTINEKIKVKPEVFADKGSNSIVDWILIEIREAANSEIIVFSKVGLLQRDGYIVDVDGTNPIDLDRLPDHYFLAIRHRNHLGVMCQEPLNKETKVIDFTTNQLEVYGEHARKEIEEIMFLWTGNADSNEYLSIQGGGITAPEQNTILLEVISDSNNIKGLKNHIKKGYSSADINLDGAVKYFGPNNDVRPVFLSIFQNPGNHRYLSNYLIREQLPD